MNKGLNIFLAVLLCVVVYIGLLLSFYSSKNVETSNPYLGDAKSTRGTYGTYAVSANSMGSNMATISVRSANSIFHHRPVFSYAPAASMPTYSQSPIGGTLSKSVASPIYTTSSAEFHSFGGGNTGGVSMSGGAVSASSSSATGLTTTMPSTSMYAYANNRNASSVVTNDLMSSVSGDIAMASSQAYAGIGNTTRGIAGRKNVPGIGGGWTGWLGNGDYWGEGYEDWAGGSNQVTWERLRALYVAATGDTDFSNEEEWEAFLAWFNSKQSDDTFGWYWVPISDAIPFVLLLCLVYVVVVYRRNKMAKNVKDEK